MPKKPNTIKITKNKNFRWINITKPGRGELKYAEKTYRIDEKDAKDCLPPIKRAKISPRENYIFLVLLFPVYNKKTREIYASEVDFFIGPNSIITVHNNDIPPLKKFGKMQLEGKLTKILPKNQRDFLHTLIHSLLDYCFPLLNDISLDIDDVKDEIFEGKEKKVVKEILIIKRNIINFRKAVQAHKGIIQKIPIKIESVLPLSDRKTELYLEHLGGHAQDIWNLLENQKESIEAFHQTNQALISFRLDSIMKFLTMISVVLMPANLIATLFGINSNNIPFIEHPGAFWIATLVASLVALTMLLIFKLRKWM